VTSDVSVSFCSEGARKRRRGEKLGSLGKGEESFTPVRKRFFDPRASESPKDITVKS